jgi:hypothetical protein
MLTFSRDFQRLISKDLKAALGFLSDSAAGSSIRR